MGENDLYSWNSNLTTTTNGWYTLSYDNSNYTIDVNSIEIDSLKEENKQLKNEIKDLKKRISNLSTLVLSHIGEEQMKNFNKKYYGTE